MEKKYENLLLKNQLCFPLYSASNTITRKYKPLLKELDLTYTQYIVMMVLWEHKEVNEKQLCDALYLKSSTLTPLLKRLKEKDYINITKDKNDSRSIIISLTETGEKLKEKATFIPVELSKSLNLTQDEAIYLYKILYKIILSE